MKNEQMTDSNENAGLKVRVKGGWLVTVPSSDPHYPGIDIEYVADETDENALSRPRVLVEYPDDGELRALIWNNPNIEDYTKEIKLEGKRVRYIDIVEQIEAAIDQGMIQRDPDDKDSILVYRSEGIETPEGWYSQNILDVASEMYHDQENYSSFLSAVEESKKDREKLEQGMKQFDVTVSLNGSIVVIAENSDEAVEMVNKMSNSEINELACLNRYEVTDIEEL